MQSCFLLIVLALIPVGLENWPNWRGADGSGVSNGPATLVKWSKTENVRWRVPLPEPANSTPVIWGKFIFLTQAKKSAGQRLLLCYDRTTGRLQWQAAVTYKEAEPTHETNPYASASPTTDGERVVVWYGSAGLHAYDMRGKLLWQRDLGRQRHTWGYAASPIIHGDRVFLNFGPGERSFLIALDKKSGRTLWQVDVPAGKGAKMMQWSPEDMYGSWATPIVVRTANRDELIVAHPRWLVAYDPATGKTLWSSEGLGELVYSSPVAGETAEGERVIVAVSGFGGPVLAVRAGGSGDVSQSHRLWHLERSKPFLGTAVINSGYLYWIDMSGVVQCVKLSNGETMWTERLPRSGEGSGAWASPVLNNGNIYIMNQSGSTVVFRANPKQFEIVGVNALEEPSNSSIVISDGDLFLRTQAALWCIGKKR
jgi:outer membrane protein assembly factor BamB